MNEYYPITDALFIMISENFGIVYRFKIIGKINYSISFIEVFLFLVQYSFFIDQDIDTLDLLHN